MKIVLNFLFAFFGILFVAKDSFAVSGSKSTLLSNSALNSTTTGSAVCLPRQAEDFVFYLKAINGAGTLPTLDVVVQMSDDSTNWGTLDTFTQATTGTSTQFRSINTASTHSLRCLRVVATLGGTGSPSYNTTVIVYYRLRN